MKKYKAAILTRDPSRIEYVYSGGRLGEIAAITDLMPGFASPDDVENGSLKDVEVVFSTWGMPALTAEQLGKMPALKAVFYAAGATDYFARQMFAGNIRVFSAWQANAIPVAEFCTAQIILALKGYFRTVRMMSETRRFEHKYVGSGVFGETVALIGAGAISTHVKELLKAYNVDVIVVPSRKEKRTVSLEEAFKTAMVISNHLPDRDDNAGVLNGELFQSMREGATFINTGRGRQVNEDDLVNVLKERKDLTALLDVTHPEPVQPDSPLFSTPNILITPHIAGSMNDEVRRMADYMIEEYKRFAAGEPCLYEVKEEMLLTSGK